VESSRIFGNYTTLAVPMFNLIIALVSPISVAYLPVFAKARRSADKVELVNLLRSALRLSAFVTAPMVVGMFVFSTEILTLLFPSADVFLGAPLLCLLMPGAAIMSTLLVVNTALEAGDMVKAPLLSMTIGSVVKIAVGYFMLSSQRFGISGAPVGTVLCYAVALFVSVSVLEGKMKIKAPIFTTHIVPYINAFIAVVSAKSLYMGFLEAKGGALSLLLAITVCGLLYLIMSILSGSITKIKRVNLAKCTKE